MVKVMKMKESIIFGSNNFFDRQLDEGYFHINFPSYIDEREGRNEKNSAFLFSSASFRVVTTNNFAERSLKYKTLSRIEFSSQFVVDC